MPKISVIMPVYNTKEEYLREAIESILNQTFADWELIAIDNGSDDYIENIIKSYTDNRIKYQRVEVNQGSAAARNIGIKSAKGKYIAFLDSDDISLPQRLEIQYNFLEQNPKIGCIGTKTDIINDVKTHKHYEFPKPTKHKDIEAHLILKGCVFCQSSVMLRKNILDENNLLYKVDSVPSEDYALWTDLIGLTQFEVLEPTLVNYRFYNENTSNKQKMQQHQKTTEIQLNTIEKYCNTVLNNKDVLIDLFNGNEISKDRLPKLSMCVDELTNALLSKGFEKEDIYSLLKHKFKKVYYHTHSLSGQWQLLKLPLNRLFKLSLIWRLTCFITRGVL